MPYDKHHWMVRFKKDQEGENLEEVIDALRSFKEATSNQIQQHINSNRKNKAKNQKKGQIDYTGIESLNKVQAISIRTVQRHLKLLIKVGMVLHRENLYTLSEKGKMDNTYFGYQFGSGILNNLINKPDFELRSIKENLSNLITIFGSYFVALCIEGTKPGSGAIYSDGDKKEHYKKLDSTMSWINSAINPSSLLHYFLFTFRNQLDDQLVSELKRLKFTGIKKRNRFIHQDEKTGQQYELDDFSSTGYMYIDKQGRKHKPRVYRDIPCIDDYLFLDKFSYVNTDYDNTPFNAIDPKIYQGLLNAFEDLYPEIYSKIKINIKH